jgi:mono/diheme cytochrome c family protein
MAGGLPRRGAPLAIFFFAARNPQGGFMGRFAVGFLTALVLCVATTGLVLATGAYNISAQKPSNAFDRLADWVKVRSVSHHAAAERAAASKDPAAVAKGMEHYASNCLPCHGAPGLEGMEFEEGMSPAPPAIDEKQVQRWSDQELAWIVKNGIGMTGMPGFGETHSDEEIAQIVAFVRHAPQLTAEEKARLHDALPHEHHHEGQEPNHQHEEGEHHHDH